MLLFRFCTNLRLVSVLFLAFLNSHVIISYWFVLVPSYLICIIGVIKSKRSIPISLVSEILHLKQNFITEFYSFFFQNTKKNETQKLNPLYMLIKKIKFNYFNKDIDKIKLLYKNRRYGTIRRKIKKGEN